MVEKKRMSWNKMFQHLLIPFEYNCYILLKTTDKGIEVVAVSKNPDAKKELDYIM